MDQFERRKAATRKKMVDALISIVLEQGHEHVRARTLTKRAGIGYATFFRHFRTMDELFCHIYREALNEVQTTFGKINSIEAEPLALYHYVRDNEDMLRVYVMLPPHHAARQMIAKEATKMIQERWQQLSDGPVPFEISINHIIESTHQLMAWFLDNLDEYTPADMAAIHNNIVMQGIDLLVPSPADDTLETCPD